MSKTSYIDKILLHPKKYNPYSHMKPAVKDSNFFFANSISFNMVETLTQFKNNEISPTNLNLNILSNLSFLFAKKNITVKKNKAKQKQEQINQKNVLRKNKIINNKEERDDFKIIEGYECYIPSKRIPIFNKNPQNEKNKKNNSKSAKKRKDTQILQNLKNFNFFRPSGRVFSQIHKSKRKTSINSASASDSLSEDFGSSSIINGSSNTINNNNAENENDNDSSGDFNLICGETADDSIFKDQEFVNLIQTNPSFPKYNGLVELIECPLEDAYSPEIKCKNFIKVLNEFINDDNNDIDYSINNNKNVFNSFSSNSQSVIVLGDDNDKNTSQKIYIINPANYEPYTNELENSKNQGMFSQSGKIKKFNIFSKYNSSIINKTSASDDIEDVEGKRNEESLFAFFEDESKKKNPSKKIEVKLRRILPRSAMKYTNKMNNQYIFLMYDKYKNISDKYTEAKKFLYDDTMVKKLYIQLIKGFILDIGFTSKKFYDKIIKYEMHSKEPINFEHFMNAFELVLTDSNKENLRYRFLLLLKLISSNDDSDQFLAEKQLNIFFDLIGCDYVYIQKFCEMLGERLILRYKAIYTNKKNDKNMQEEKYVYRKVKIILESFLDSLDS
jgi:hypothetical protein